MTAFFAVAFFVTLALFGVTLIGGQQQRDDLRRRLRGEKAARRVVEAALRAEVRDHAVTRRAWADERAGATPLHDRLKATHDAFARDVETIRALPEVDQ